MCVINYSLVFGLFVCFLLYFGFLLLLVLFLWVFFVLFCVLCFCFYFCSIVLFVFLNCFISVLYITLLMHVLLDYPCSLVLISPIISSSLHLGLMPFTAHSFYITTDQLRKYTIPKFNEVLHVKCKLSVMSG